MQTIRETVELLKAGAQSAVETVGRALDLASQPGLRRSFTAINAEAALEAAAAVDERRAAGQELGEFAGVPIVVKDLFDVAGQETRAGSVAMQHVLDGAAAVENAVAVQRLVDAGFVIIGRTHMTEFAYSGLGLNINFETPRAPWEREADHGGRIPGGSSSGSAVAVADGVVSVGLGTDTGGSCRIPATFCGLVGLKPTARRVPRTGVLPLAPSFDSVGPMASTVECAAIVDRIIASEEPREVRLPTDSSPAGPVALGTVTLGAVTNFVTEGLDQEVADGYSKALDTLSGAGVQIVEVDLRFLHEIPEANTSGGIAAYEAFSWHRDYLPRFGELYDPRVRQRIEAGADISPGRYEELLVWRASFIESMRAAVAPFDAAIMPSVAIVPPTIASLQGSEDLTSPQAELYWRLNGLALRNTSVANVADCASISLPIAHPSGAPVGLSLLSYDDDRLVGTAAALEAILNG